MNLIIDQGNTSTKVAIYNEGDKVKSFLYKDFTLSIIDSLLDEIDIEYGILSSVVDKNQKLISLLEKRLKQFIYLDEMVKIPIQVKYKTPEKLGKDRLAAVVGASYLKPECNLLVIDAGTAITYEVIEASGKYIGGNISPGMTTRFKALNFFTKKLPLTFETEDIPVIGTDTESAIQAGVVNGIVYEMDGYIDNLRQKYPDLLVFLTGGHSFYFERRLKNSIFADINLVLTGLNRILQYNVEN